VSAHNTVLPVNGPSLMDKRIAEFEDENIHGSRSNKNLIKWWYGTLKVAQKDE
jgi:hypothetical protein